MTEQKTIAAALGPILTWMILSAAAHMGLSVPMDVVLWLPSVITTLLVYYVPASKRDIAINTTNETVKIANALPENETTAIVVDANTSKLAAQSDAKAGNLPDDVAEKALKR